ncbi:RING/FYVE/PHD zinc finger superfamily protein [Abeliophyllum distichum]|uniref:RING/FYVE/PHD zinc finger superfamily protein n=1 Tax=Abeliophyllum distichum TaxID=126358 RepID=A0ABD1U0J1_9LAMI
MAKPTISMSNNDKKLGSLGESSSLMNRRETKAAQPDGKSTGLLKSSSLVARRSSDLPYSSGEFKRPSSYAHNTTGVSSANLVGNFEQKLDQTVSKEDSSSCAAVAERPPCNNNEPLHDGLLQPREATNSGERMREHSGNRPWQGNNNGGRAIFCQKCKEFGHLAQSCTADDPLFPAVGPNVKFSRGENDNLKVAIEAAMLRKPGVHRKHRAGGQSDDSSVSSMNSDIACRDQLSSSGGKINVSSAAEIIERHAVPSGLTADSLKQETCDTSKQSTLLPVEALPSGGGESVPIVALDGKSSLGGTSTCVSAAVPICLKSLVIPEHECIWQGSFEVFRSGTILDLRDGIQAHLSTCASPKVIEAVNKFNHRIILKEVPRLSTWPVQFQEFGVREDNIALFFFASDRESYEKSYKILLESMMRNDLALKANLNGWNMLFFLWGVFRGKKENCSQHLPESPKQFCTPPDISPAIMSLPENRCSLGPIAKDLSACDDVSPALEVSASGKLWSSLSSEVVNGDCGTKVLSVDQLDDRLDSISLSTERSTSAKLCHKMSGTCLEGDIDSIFTPESESQASLRTTRSPNGSTTEQILMQLDAASDRRQPSHYFDKSPAGTNVMAGIILDKMNSTKDQVKFRMNSDKEASLGGDRDLHMKESNRWLLNHSEHLHDESNYLVPKTVYTGTSRAVPRNDSADVVLEKENGSGEGSNENVIPERYFFPVDPHRVNGIGFVNKSIPWKMHTEVEDELHDKVPDLELALGAERKPLPQSIPPFLVGKVEKKIPEEHHLNKAASRADDDASASLSLSLSFPS